MSRLRSHVTLGEMLYVHEVEGREESIESDVYIGTVEMCGDNDREYLETVDMHDTDPWTITLKVKQVCIRLKIDTGAYVTVISENRYSQLGKKKGKRKVQGVPQSQTAALPRP